MLLTDIGEITTRELAKELKLQGLEENKTIAKTAGEIANDTRKNIGSKFGKAVVNSKNSLNYKYLDENRQIQ